MKIRNLMIAASLLCMSAAASATEVLVQYDYYAGFSPNPGSETITIQSDGKVEFNSEYRMGATGKVVRTRYVLARLNQKKIDALKQLLPKIKEQDLKDLDEGKPMCTDAPSHSISIPWGRVTVTIDREASCHHWANETPEAEQVRSIMNGLAQLSNLR